MYIYIYICMYVYIYIYIHTCIYIHIHMLFLIPSESQTRTSHGWDLDSLHDHTTSLFDLQTTEDNRPGHICGGTNVTNQWETGPRHHGPRFNRGLPAVCQRLLGRSVLAVVGPRERRLESLRTLLIQGMSGNNDYYYHY